MARVHAVIVTYNSAAEIDRCLVALSEQTDVFLRTTVVDNASTDGTISIIKRCHPTVELICLNENVGFARANNIVFRRESPPDLWLILNPDAFLSGPRDLITLAQRFNTFPRVGALGCRLVRETGEVDHAGKRSIPTPWSALSYFLGLHRLFPHSRTFASYVAGHIPDDQGPVQVECINGAFMLVRPDLIRDTDGFDERFFMYAEDIDLCLRIRKLNWNILYDPTVTVVHLKGASAGGIGFHRSNGRDFARSMLTFYRKHYASRYPFLFSIFVLLGLRALASVASRSKSAQT